MLMPSSVKSHHARGRSRRSGLNALMPEEISRFLASYLRGTLLVWKYIEAMPMLENVFSHKVGT